MRQLLACISAAFFLAFVIHVSFASGSPPEKDVRATIIYKDTQGIAKGNIGIKALSKSLPDESVPEKIKKEGGEIRRKFESINAVSVKLSESALKELLRDPNVIAVERSEPVKAFLQDSVPLINADDVWQKIINGTSITGRGTSICVIDTGIDYTHPDFGNCTIRNRAVSGQTEAYLLESLHPYQDNTTVTWKINKTGYSSIAVHFSSIATEPHFDYIYIYDGNNNTVANYTGEHSDIWSPAVSGDTMYVSLVSDPFVNASGFVIDTVINGSVNDTYDWSSCTKVLGGTDIRNEDDDPFDDYGHGTHVAGIAAANGSIKGVAPGAGIVAVKVLNSAGTGDSADVVAGIDWCTAHRDEYNISAISMSLGNGLNSTFCDPGEPATKTAINAAVAKNISVVVAAGNSGSSSGVSYPACIQNATRVGATTKADAVASYTNRGTGFPDMLLAPGSSINSTRAGALCPSAFSCSGNYMVGSGTSMATPHVSGAVALLSEAYNLLYGTPPTPAFLRERLNGTGKRIPDIGLNFARIDALSALNSLSPPNITPYNNITNDGSALVSLNESGSAFFNITADQNVTYLWYLNSSLQNFSGSYFAWRPNFTSAGNWTVKAVASNGWFNNSFEWNITVLNVNLAPYISPALLNKLMQRQNQTPYNVSANVHDDDRDNLTISVDDGNITVSGFVLYFNYTALLENKTVTIVVNDSVLSASQAINITIIDTLGPQIFIASPQNKTYNSSPVSLNFSLDEPAGWCGYSLNGAGNVTLDSCQNAALNATEGANIITLYANDTLGNSMGTALQFSVDTSTPRIDVVAANYTRDDFVEVRATISESPDSCVLDFGNTAYSMLINGTICTYNVSQLNPGTYNFRVFANNSAGNWNRTGNFSVQVYYCPDSYSAWSGCSQGKRTRTHTSRDCSTTGEEEQCTVSFVSSGSYTSPPSPNKTVNETSAFAPTPVAPETENKTLVTGKKPDTIRNITEQENATVAESDAIVREAEAIRAAAEMRFGEMSDARQALILQKLSEAKEKASAGDNSAARALMREAEKIMGEKPGFSDYVSQVKRAAVNTALNLVPAGLRIFFGIFFGFWL